MAFVGLVGAPLSYAEWAAARAGSTALAPIAEAVSGAAVASVLAEGALVLGAGLAGYAIGQYILSKLQPDAVYPPAQGLYKIGEPGELWHVRGKSQLRGQTEVFYDNFFTAPILVPLEDTVNEVQKRVYARVGNTSEKQGYFTYNPGDLLEPWTLVSAERITPEGGGKILRAPGFPYKEPTKPLTFPTTVPVPGIPDPFPITPTVIPNPDNEPDEDNKQGEPGIIVQVPETGQQFKFTPTGVEVTNYRSPTVQPDPVPKVPLPPIFPPAATQPCPCPEVDLSEVIRRLKDLGRCDRCSNYLYTTHEAGFGNSATVQVTQDELVSVVIDVIQLPSNARNQYGGGNAPNVLYAGWFSWMKDSRPLERIPLNYEIETFLAPKSADGYSFTIYTGGSAASTYITRKRVDPPEPPI